MNKFWLKSNTASRSLGLVSYMLIRLGAIFIDVTMNLKLRGKNDLLTYDFNYQL